MEPGTPPILFLVFNRLKLAERVFERIREARPAHLFLAADGPRAVHPEDVDACRKVRDIVAGMDWPCRVETLFRDTNLGCRAAVSSAIAWFFEHVEEGIILEDDCLPNPSFFPYCAELLARYRHDDRVSTIGGLGYPQKDLCGSSSYAFTTYQLIWGWATWKRAWAHYRPEVAAESPLLSLDWLRMRLGNRHAAEVWRRNVALYREGVPNTWDYPWNFSCWLRGGLGIAPATNLVDNIGFGVGATHTGKANNPLLPAEAITFPLRHPRHVRCNRRLDREYDRLFLPAPQKPMALMSVLAKSCAALGITLRGLASRLHKGKGS